MKLEALNRISGVKVLAGKGEGGKTAFAGDIFEAVSAKETERLINLGVAKEYVVEDKLAGKKTAAKKAPAKKTAGKKADDGSDTADDADLGLGE